VVNLIEFKFLTNQSDNHLVELIQFILKKGEIEWFEAKRSYGDLKELPKLLSSISNKGGGLIFYGYDAKKKNFVNINPDKLEQVINQKSDMCEPKLIVEYHIINNNNKIGLFCGIPAMEKPVMDNNKRYYLRKGSHKKEVTKERVQEIIHKRKIKKGHLYMEKFKQCLYKVAKIKFCNKIDYYIESFEFLGEKLISQILNQWEIKFEPWLGDSDQNYPLRIHFKSWKRNPKNDSYNELKINILNLIKEIIELLSLLENKYNFDILNKTLKDLSVKENGETHHRRCLTTLVNQEKMWNFTDARIFIKKENDNFLIYQDEAGKDLIKNIACIDNVNKSEIEKIITKHNRKKCSIKAKEIVETIKLELNKIKSTICAK